jgi:hypothetical protein
MVCNWCFTLMMVNGFYYSTSSSKLICSLHVLSPGYAVSKSTRCLRRYVDNVICQSK